MGFECIAGLYVINKHLIQRKNALVKTTFGCIMLYSDASDYIFYIYTLTIKNYKVSYYEIRTIMFFSTMERGTTPIIFEVMKN